MSPSTRLLTISVSPECRAACRISDEINKGIAIIWPINAIYCLLFCAGRCGADALGSIQSKPPIERDIVTLVTQDGNAPRGIHWSCARRGACAPRWELARPALVDRI